MRKLSNEAFVTMGICSKCKNPFGITVDKTNTKNNEYVFVWAFKLNAAQVHREGYNTQNVHGSIAFDDEYPGCPYCEEKQFYSCGECGSIVCWHGERDVVCPKCGNRGTVTEAEEFNIIGGEY